MNEQQREAATAQASISQHVIIEGRASASGESEHVLYTVHIPLTEDAPGVTMTPEPPGVHERERVLLEACRLLERREESAETGEGRQQLTQALRHVTREIDMLP